MSSYGSYTKANEADAGTYSVPLGPSVEQVLRADPEEVALGLTVPDVSFNEAFDQMAGMQGDDQRWEAILRTVASLPLSSDEARWEQADPQHRIGKLLQACWQAYQEHGGKAAEKSAGFFRWLDEMPEMRRISMIADAIKRHGTMVLGTTAQKVAFKQAEDQLKAGSTIDARANLRPSVVKAFVKGVAYLDAATRRNYRVTFEQGVAKYQGANFDTAKMKTVFSGLGVAIWVMGEDGHMYAGSHVYGELHHSSFFSGGAIKAGGEIRAHNGEIEFLSGKSGHYQPPIQNLVAAVKVLRDLAPHLNAEILVWRAGAPELISVDELLVHGMLFSSWGDISEQFRFDLQRRYALRHGG